MTPASILTVLLATAAPLAPTGRIVAEWDPGLTGAELGGQLVVDSYGVPGLGAYRIALEDGTTALAVCVQADVGHSVGADYAVAPGATLAPELAYLTWAYLAGATPPTDEQAAAVNALAWRYTNAQRRTGGPVWQDGDLAIHVLGVGSLSAVEQLVGHLHAEATARRGPWTLTDATLTAHVAVVVLAGPGGPISGVEVTFDDGAGWRSDATTDDAGRASATVPAGVVTVQASARGPGAAVALAAPGSQRLAMPGPAALVTAALTVPAPPTTSTTTTSTTTTSTTVPATTTSTTTSTTTASTSSTSTSSTSTTSAPAATTTIPSTTTVPAPTTTAPPGTTATTTTTTTTTTTPTTTMTKPPPSLPPTGSGRDISRAGAVLFAVGAGAVLLASPRRRTGQ